LTVHFNISTGDAYKSNLNRIWFLLTS